MRNVRWVRGLTKVSDTSNTDTNQEQIPYVGPDTANEQQRVQSIEDRLNGK